jgi:hypothetical protein
MNTSKLAHQARLKTWAETFQNQKESGLTVMEWCSRNGVSKNAFFYWKRKLRDELVESRLPEIVRLPLTAEPGSFEVPASDCTSSATDYDNHPKTVDTDNAGCTSCTSHTPRYPDNQKSGTDDAERTGCASCTSRTTDTTPAAIPKLSSSHHSSGSLIIHIQDISIEIHEDTPDALVTRMIKAVRDA